MAVAGQTKGALREESRPKLLIVDRRDETAIPVKMVLGDVRYEYDVARNSTEAVTKVLHGKPDAVVIDADTIGVAGVDLAGWLQHSDETRHIPLLVVMAQDSDATSMWREVEAARLSKPIVRDDLRRMVRRLLSITDLI